MVAVPTGFESEIGRQGGFSAYSEVSPSEFVLRVIAQCTLQPGLSAVYEEIVLQGHGNELYAAPIAANEYLHGVPFGDLWRFFPKATPLGVLRQEAGVEAPQLHLSPDNGFVMRSSDSLVLLAGDEKDAAPQRSKLSVGGDVAASGKLPAVEQLSSGRAGASKRGWRR